MPLTPPRASFLVIPDLLDPAACRRVRVAMDRGVAEPAEVLGAGVAVDRVARRASSIEVDAETLADVEAAIESARAAIASHFAAPLLAREGPSFLRYGPGGFYRRHRDRAASAAWPDAARRRISVVIFLGTSRAAAADRGDFGGGELALYPEGADGRPADEPDVIIPRQGCLVAFHASTAHEVRPVSAGVRDAIVDWFY